jgi:hypothetical protein
MPSYETRYSIQSRTMPIKDPIGVPWKRCITANRSEVSFVVWHSVCPTGRIQASGTSAVALTVLPKSAVTRPWASVTRSQHRGQGTAMTYMVIYTAYDIALEKKRRRSGTSTVFELCIKLTDDMIHTNMAYLPAL